MKANSVLIHVSGCIGTKGKNRNFFEKKLFKNIKKSLGSNLEIKRSYGLVEISGDLNLRKIKNKLEKIPGIANFSFCFKTETDIEKIKKLLDEITKNLKVKTFKIESKRDDKSFKYTAHQLNEILGDFLVKKRKWKVKLKNPSKTFFVEVTKKHTFIYTKKYKGLGGLPISSSGKLISLLSGGIDSPVAAFEMMKRGCSIVFLHFHNLTRQREEVKNKIFEIVEKLNEFQQKSKLYLVDFSDIQKEIIAKVDAKYRMIIYRRIMFSIANEIAKKEKALGFVTGDNLGQVASQTLENLDVIFSASKFYVYAPLISKNKEEIIEESKKLGIYELSILPYPDCCSFIIAKHPELKASLKKIKEMEKNLNKKLQKEAIKKLQSFIFK